MWALELLMIIDSAVVCNGVSVSTQTMLVERGELAIYKRTDTRIQYSPSPQPAAACTATFIFTPDQTTC